MRRRNRIAITFLGGILLSADGVTLATVDPNARVELPPLSTILREWSVAMSVDRPRQLHFRRYEYDSIFYLEKRNTGSFTLDRDEKARFLMAAAKIPEGAASRKIHNGVPYELASPAPFQWYWGDSNLYMLDPVEMTAWRTACHLEPAWFDWCRYLRNPKTAFPFMLGMSEEELKTLCDWKTDENWKRRDAEIHLVGTVLTAHESLASGNNPLDENLDPRRSLQHFVQIEVLLDRQTYEIRALRFRDHVDNETVYVIDRIVDVTGEFWTPDLTGYEIE